MLRPTHRSWDERRPALSGACPLGYAADAPRAGSLPGDAALVPRVSSRGADADSGPAPEGQDRVRSTAGRTGRFRRPAPNMATHRHPGARRRLTEHAAARAVEHAVPRTLRSDGDAHAARGDARHRPRLLRTGGRGAGRRAARRIGAERRARASTAGWTGSDQGARSRARTTTAGRG